ncbi:MAG: alpha/beta fold hydrolase [Sulfuritalea sp.]|nr:alpha/beta fold hydrolase [Sulfuritalea sp.]
MIALWLLVLIATIGLLAALRRAIHRSLAPERVIEARTPADVGLQYQDATIATENGKSLFGWFIPAKRSGRSPAAVALHGWGGNAETLLPLAPPLHEAGFALLLIDARCHGKSDEDSFVSMPRFGEDLGHAIDWLMCREDIDPHAIAAIGHSVGAGAVLLAASRRADLVAVVSIAAFTHPVTMMRRWFASKGIPYRPVGWLMLRYVEWVIGHRFDDIAPVNTIRRVACPTLLVHGADDTTVPVSEAHAIHAARSGDQVQLKVVAGSHDDYTDLGRELPVLVEFLSNIDGRPRKS